MRRSQRRTLFRGGWPVQVFVVLFVTLVAVWAMGAEIFVATQAVKKITAGAYYFDGWAGRNELAGNTNELWARNAPAYLTKRMIEEFPEREPVWGWRDDSQEIMERQIDLAADHGLSFFAFCWYWQDDGKAINKKKIREDPKHTGLELFLKVRNNHRLKFCLLIANHQGFEIKGTENWKQAADFWLPYFKHPLYLTVGGKPLLIIFNPQGGDKAGFAYLQEAARQAGLPGVAIVGCGGGASEMGYTQKTHYIAGMGSGGSEAHKYAELMDANRRAWGGLPEQPYIPLVMAGWDKRPWEGPAGLFNKAADWYYPDRTPEQFASLLRDAITWMDKHPEQTTDERLVMIYAWNEFGEGGYIAPTKGDPQGQYLKALHLVLTTGPSESPTNKEPKATR